MKHKHNYRKFILERQVRNVSQRLWVFHYLIPVLDLVCVVFLLLRNIQQQLKLSFAVMQSVFSTVQQNYLTPQSANAFALFGNMISIAIIILCFVRYQLIENYDNVTKHATLSRYLLYLTMLGVYVFEIGIYLVIWSFSEISKNQGIPFGILACALPSIVYTLFNTKMQTSSLFGKSTVPLILIITLPTASFSYIAAIALMAHSLYNKKRIIKKIFSAITILVVLSILRSSSFTMQSEKIGANQVQVSLLFLGLLAAIAPICILKAKQSLLSTNSDQKSLNIYETLTHLKRQNPHAELSFRNYFKFYNQVFDLLLSIKDTKTAETESIMEKQPSKISKDEYLILLERYLDKECKRSATNNTLKYILLVKVRILMNYSFSNVIEDLFLVNEELQKVTGKFQFQFFELFDMVIQKYGVFRHEELESNYVFHLNKMHEDFESNVYNIVDRLSLFWKQIASKQVQIMKVNQSFREILTQKTKIDQNFQRMTKIQGFATQRNVISILRNMFNPYQVEKSSVDTSYKQKQLNEKETLAFIIMENTTIKFVSKDFLKLFCGKKNLVYQSVDKNELFGQELGVIVENHIKNMSQATQKKWITVPILLQQRFIRLMNIMILWYPSLDVKNRVMIKFDTEDGFEKDAYLIYQYKTDTINYFNQGFIKIFEIDHQMFFNQLNNYQIFFNELFVNADVPVQLVKQCLIQQNSIRCKIYLKRFVQKCNPQTFQVDVSVFQSIKIDDQLVYCILKVTKTKQKQKATSVSKSQTHTQSRIARHVKIQGNYQTTNQQGLAKMYANEKFFCKIANQYGSKVTEKQAQLEEEGRFSYRYLMHGFFFILICTLLVFWCMEGSFLEDRISSYKQGLKAIENTSEQYALLYQAYSLAIKRYYIQKLPEQTLIVNKVPAFVFDNIYATVEQKFLDEFIRRYLTQINQQPNRVIDYSIDFTMFSISTDTGKSTLMDFAENIRRHIVSSELTFLLKNYGHLRQLTVDYQTSFSFSEDLNKNNNKFEINIWVVLAAGIFFPLLITLILYRIEATIQMVYELIQKFDSKELINHFNSFSQNKTQIQKMFRTSLNLNISDQQIKNTKSSSTSCSSISNDQLLSITEVQLLKGKTEAIVQEVQKSYFQNNQNESQRSMQIQTNKQNRDQQTLLDKSKKQLNNPPQKTVAYDPFLVKFVRMVPLVALLIGIIVIVLLDRKFLVYQRDGMIQLFEMKTSLYVALLHVKRQQVDAPIIPTVKYFYNIPFPNKYAKPEVTLINAIPKKIILQELQDFGHKANAILSTDMCQLNTNIISIAIKPCKSYLGGFLTKGFKEAFDPFVTNAYIVADQNMSDFGPYPCTEAKCPPYHEHAFVSVIMGETVRYLISMLSSETQVAFQKLREVIRVITIFKVLGLAVVSILYCLYASYLKCRCEMALHFFRMVPKNIMCSLKMTNFLKKNHVLSKLDIL